MNHLVTPPLRVSLPILQKLIATYEVWQEFLRNFPKDLRYTLGAKIDVLHIETTEAIFMASCVVLDQKLPFIQKASIKLDLLKFFLQVAWESKGLDNKRYITLSEHFAEIGKQLGGWQKDTLKKINPA